MSPIRGLLLENAEFSLSSPVNHPFHDQTRQQYPITTRDESFLGFFFFFLLMAGEPSLACSICAYKGVSPRTERGRRSISNGVFVQLVLAEIDHESWDVIGVHDWWVEWCFGSWISRCCHVETILREEFEDDLLIRS